MVFGSFGVRPSFPFCVEDGFCFGSSLPELSCPGLMDFLDRRRSVISRYDDNCLWTLSQAGLASAFKSVVKAALVHAGDVRLVDIFPHQAKKFAVSYCW